MAKADQEVSSKKLKEMVLECLKKMQDVDPDLIPPKDASEEEKKNLGKIKKERKNIIMYVIFVISGEDLRP
jgi:hypothetical protein